MNWDIAMCGSETCERAESCMRSPKSGTVPDERQTWADFTPESECDFYWPKTKGGE